MKPDGTNEMKTARFRNGAYLVATIVALLICVACTTPGLDREEQKLQGEIRSNLTPQWSADGQVVVGYADYHLYGASAGGRDLWRITKRESSSQSKFALSADNRLAYMTYDRQKWRRWFDADAGQRHLVIADLEGKNART